MRGTNVGGGGAVLIDELVEGCDVSGTLQHEGHGGSGLGSQRLDRWSSLDRGNFAHFLCLLRLVPPQHHFLGCRYFFLVVILFFRFVVVSIERLKE